METWGPHSIKRHMQPLAESVQSAGVILPADGNQMLKTPSVRVAGRTAGPLARGSRVGGAPPVACDFFEKVPLTWPIHGTTFGCTRPGESYPQRGRRGNYPAHAKEQPRGSLGAYALAQAHHLASEVSGGMGRG